MDRLEQITTLLKSNGINATAKQLKIKKADIYKFLKDNGLTYEDGEVQPITDIRNEIAITKVIERDKVSNSKPLDSIIQKDNKDIDIESLKELISLKDDLKELIQQYNKSKNIIDVKPIELSTKSGTNFKQKLFKIDADVLEQWEKFVAEHKQYKVQNLISLAIEEFINKYK